MKLSVKSDYATRAVLGLALQYSEGRPLRIETLASTQAVPANYLVQILIDLKAHGIVHSVRGKDGGYRLSRPPSQITFGDVLRALHGEVFGSPAIKDKDCEIELRRAWQFVSDAASKAADSITFQQLADQSNPHEKMYYI